MVAAILIGLNNPARAQEGCGPLEIQVKECEAILEMTGPLISAQNRKISLLESSIENLNSQHAELETQLDLMRAPWYERPSFVVPATVISVLLIQKGLGK